jgi:hypothetical protein
MPGATIPTPQPTSPPVSQNRISNYEPSRRPCSSGAIDNHKLTPNLRRRADTKPSGIAIDAYVSTDIEHDMLICVGCRAGVKLGAGPVETHFRVQHKLKGNALQSILQSYGAETFNDPATADVPAVWSNPVSQLPILVGYSCNVCRYFTTSKSTFLQHWRGSTHEGCIPRYWIVGETRDEVIL